MIYRDIVFDSLNINSQEIRIQANLSLDGPWTFLSEVDFFAEQYQPNYLKQIHVDAPQNTFVLFLFIYLSIYFTNHPCKMRQIIKTPLKSVGCFY